MYNQIQRVTVRPNATPMPPFRCSRANRPSDQPHEVDQEAERRDADAPKREDEIPSGPGLRKPKPSPPPTLTSPARGCRAIKTPARRTAQRPPLVNLG